MLALVWFTWFWIAWLSVLVGGFATVETIALRGKRQPYDALTSNIQWVLKKHTAIRWSFLGALGLFNVWLVIHFSR